MKVALVASTIYNPNQGVAGATVALGEALRELGVEVTYVWMDDLQRANGSMKDKILFPWRLAARPDIYQYDVVEAAANDGWRLGLKARRPTLVMRSHGLENTLHDQLMAEVRAGRKKISWKYGIYHGGWRLYEEKQAARRADMAVLLNKRDRQYVIEKFGVPPERARWIANGIPTSFLNQPLLPLSESPDAPFEMAFVGSYISRKGVEYARPALINFLGRHRCANITFYGVGGAAEQIPTQFPDTVRAQIHLVPRFQRPELPERLRGKAVLLFPSLSEGFPLAVPEAMACGLVPAAAAIPGVVEIAQDGENALLYPPANSEAIEQTLESLIQNRPLLNRLRCNAHATAQNYGWDRIARDTLALYEEARQIHKSRTRT